MTDSRGGAARVGLGRYYTLAHRLAGSRVMFTRRVDEDRASYRALGVFVALELALRAGSSLAATARRVMHDQQPGVSRDGEGEASQDSAHLGTIVMVCMASVSSLRHRHGRAACRLA